MPTDLPLALAALNLAGLSQRSLSLLSELGADPRDILARPDPGLLIACGVAPPRVPAVMAALRRADAPELARRLAACGARVVLFGDPEYPPLLAQLPRAPALLYVRGRLDPSATHAAGVGSRSPSAEGRAGARRVAGGLARAGIVVVSGGAYGIDAVAHEAALEANAPTVCVTGTGPDVDYPARNAALFARIVDGGGAVVSVFPPGTPGLAHHFPARNEVVVGMSRGAVIAEAREKSGTLITARLALDFSRDVFVLPGDSARESCRGSNLLLRDGHARCILDAQDVLAEWGLARPAAPVAPGGPFDPALAPAYRAVADSPRDADALGRDVSCDPGVLAGVLARLEALGWV